MRRFESVDCNRKLKFALHKILNLVKVTLWSFVFALKDIIKYACQSCNIVKRIIILYTVIVALHLLLKKNDLLSCEVALYIYMKYKVQHYFIFLGSK